MVLVRFDLSEATVEERTALLPHLEGLRQAGATVVVEDKANLVKQARAIVLTQLRTMQLRAGDAFGERERSQLLTLSGAFNPRQREAIPLALRDLVDSGFFDIDARGTLMVSRAGQAELYPLSG